MAEETAPRSRKRKSRGWVRALLILLISLVIGVTVYRWNARRLLGNSLPMPFGFGAAVVLSGSMEPNLNINDLVIVTPAAQYQIGDIIVFQSTGDLVIHRIISINEAEKTLQTKGDANNIADDPISLDQVKGKLSFKLPFIGLIVRGLKTPVGVIAVLLAAVYLMHISWRTEKKQKDETLDAIKEEIRRLKAEQQPGKPGPNSGPQPGQTGAGSPTPHAAEGEDKHE